jgi:NADP-dependent 3-hydroxy acid dehydrogenase YdfG
MADGNKGVIVVAGFGPGISSAVALKWGKAGFKVALFARTQEKLDAAAKGELQSSIKSLQRLIQHDTYSVRCMHAILCSASAISGLVWENI